MRLSFESKFKIELFATVYGWQKMLRISPIFVKLKRHEKQPWKSVTFSKVAG